jgi:hypothetical protein
MLSCAIVARHVYSVARADAHSLWCRHRLQAPTVRILATPLSQWTDRSEGVALAHWMTQGVDSSVLSYHPVLVWLSRSRQPLSAKNSFITFCAEARVTRSAYWWIIFLCILSLSLSLSLYIYILECIYERREISPTLLERAHACAVDLLQVTYK